ncbi:probable allantoicase [Colias croceus]|uniref:probable allantoicase n=1 Tax=Colias crocea TaxID=72248 RepID=UPI001E27E4E8|nr:probable allantoicase [Colias croceus]
MIDSKPPAFTNLNDYAKEDVGAKVLFATDDFFAICDNMLLRTEPEFIADKYTEYGKLMDGWETRRKRVEGHDWCIIRLATICTIKGLLIDTAYFIGNYAPKYSIQAAVLRPEDEAIIPKRNASIGTGATEDDFKQINKLRSDGWEEIVPLTVLQPGNEVTRRNYQKVLSDEAWTHIRINIFPDGGIARLSVFGEAMPPVPPPDQLIDLISMLNGGKLLGFSNGQFSSPKNLIKPEKSQSMADGWETARRLDRPKVITAYDNGTITSPGEEYAVFKLGFTGRVKKICADTTQFKGNYPDTIRFEGVNLGNKEWEDSQDIPWKTILGPVKLSANREHWFDSDTDAINHVRVIIAPDGGMSRVRMYGFVESNEIM